MRQYCSCEWSDGGEVLALCAAHQHFEALARGRLQTARPELLRELLQDALGALDTIATEPVDPADGYNHAKADRFIAKDTARRIRARL